MTDEENDLLIPFIFCPVIIFILVVDIMFIHEFELIYKEMIISASSFGIFGAIRYFI